MTTEPNSHDFLREQAPFYALGNLSDAERSAFEAHLNGCAQCKAVVTAFLAVCGALAQTVEQHDPPAALRRRVLGAARRAPEAPYRLSALAPWFATAQAPVSAGLLKPDETGRLTSVLDTPSDIPAPAALAVTIEPEGGSPGPTGAKYLVGLAH